MNCCQNKIKQEKFTLVDILSEGIVTGLQSGYSPLTFIPATTVIIKTVSVHTRLQLTVRTCPMVRT